MQIHKKLINSDYYTAVILFFFIFSIYLLCPIVTSFDSKYYIPLTKSIIYEGNFDLDEYVSFENDKDYRITNNNGHYYSYFPYANSILAIPLVFFLDFILRISSVDIEPIILQVGESVGINPDIILKVIDNRLYDLLYEKTIASIVSALCVILFYFIARKYLNNNYAILISLIFAFATSLWSVASRGFWMHGPSILFLELAFLGMLYAKEKPHLSIYVGIPLSIAYIIRPTNAISLVLFSLYMLYCNRDSYKRIGKYCILTFIPLFLFIILNLSIYNAILPPYFLAERITNFSPVIFEALIGNVFSPARGLLIFSPFFIFSIYGVYLKIKTKSIDIFDIVVLMTIFFHWIAISMYPHWWAGHSYGPRFFLDVNPLLLYFIIPVLSKISSMKPSSKKIWTFVLLVLVGISVIIHLKGAVIFGVWDWNGTPLNVDENPWRIWDFHDIQFLR
ncbi:hypothetical protein ACKUB1_11365 [Methanospirillum stamsii]|uniref:Glycosyltransferase RgtA/B/C/D-like domain-containing protein n=1 Tax=Methanospirillum stamsii TaxID=1277351 RepID=A0A2V2N5U0_9EURY|nr:hypothetical protein [Methanospirillum stamsii]PWR71868.1 hypothetical protein DLD82_12675 [Methanospirillum stamsii]